MATMVASRFSVLSLDVDDDVGRSRKQDKKKTPLGDSSSVKDKSGSKSSGSAQSKQQEAKKKNIKKKGDTNGQQNGPKKGGNTAGQQQKNTKQTTNTSGQKGEVQWEEWKKKDQEFVSDSYQNDLHEAMLQSKLDFDEARKLRKAQGLSDIVPDKGSKKKNKPQKPQTMSLEEFNNMKKAGATKKETEAELDEEDANFFDKINEIAAKALDQELKTEHFKARMVQPVNDVHVTLAQFQNVLEKRNKEIAALEESVAKLEFELSNVKARNSKLCAMLAQGEMKDKVDVLLEVERLKTGREELLAEVQSLHAQLEQERSKVHDLAKGSEKQKSKNKK